MKASTGERSLLKDLRNIILLWLAAVIILTLGVLLVSGLPLKMIPMVFLRFVFSPFVPAFVIFLVVLLLYSGWAIWWRGASDPAD